MEQLIVSLLQNFEQGKMTRRQLIQSLTLAATSAVAAAPSAAATGKGFKAISVNHISYQVSDYTKIRDFYADLLGLKIIQDTGKQCYLSFGDTFIIPRNAPEHAPRIEPIAYTIDNWNKEMVEAELKAAWTPTRTRHGEQFSRKRSGRFRLANQRKRDESLISGLTA